MKTILFTALAAASMSAAAEPWSGIDKRLHFAGGLAIASAVTLATGDRNAGFWAGTAVGLAKELHDGMGHGHASAKDFVVTALGAYVGSRATGWVITPRSIRYSVSF